MRLSAAYTLLDVCLGADRSAINEVSVRISEGMKLLGATTSRISGDAAASGRADWLHQGQLRDQPHANPARSVARRHCGADRTAHRAIVPKHTSAGGAVLSRRPSREVAMLASSRAKVAATVELQINMGFETTVLDKAFDISTQYYLVYDWGLG